MALHPARAAQLSGRRRLAVARAATTTTTTTQTSTSRVLTKRRADAPQLEAAVLDALSSAKGRGKEGLSQQQLDQLNGAVEALEQIQGVPAPTRRLELDGKWQLLYTSRPGTASPIQRTFVGVEAFSVFQEVALQQQQQQVPRVNNIVDFGASIGYLKVEAEASTDSRPLEGFTPRQGAGLPLFGKSSTYAPARPDMRIDFQFDRAAFHFSALPFTIPYPVPFRILGDERKGWIDTTYMNQEGTFRIARGNKGTLFILKKDVPLKQRLLAAAQAGQDAEVLGLMPLLQEASPIAAPAASPAISGTWRLVWSQQADNASPLQKWGTQQSRNYQVIDASAGTLENVVDLGFAQVRAQATCAALSDVRTDVAINGAGLTLGGAVRVPLGVKGTGFVDWLYLDDDLRVTKGSKGSLFVHVREPDGTV